MWVLVLAVTRGQSGDVGVGCVEMWVLAVTPGQSGDVGLVLAVIPGAVWRCECWLSPGGSLEMWLLAVTRGQSGDVAVGCHPKAVWRCGIGVSCHPVRLKGDSKRRSITCRTDKKWSKKHSQHFVC